MKFKKLTPAILFRTVILPAALFFGVTFYLLYKPALELFPQNDTHFQYSTESDGNFEDGNSTTSVDTTQKHLTFSYTLGDQSETPYAQLVFHAHQLFRSINLTHFDNVVISIHPEESSDFTVTLHTYVPGVSNEADALTHRPYSFVCRPKAGQKIYKLPLKEFATPTWWFSAMNLRHEELPSTSWEKITHLTISAATQQKNVPLNITIEELKFSDSLLPALLYSFLISFIYVLFFFLISEQLRIKKNKQIKQRLYHPESRTSYTAEEKETLLKYLTESYSDPLLTLEKIDKVINLNQFQVSEIIHDTFKMRYKQYINLLRIEEAKKLLTTTDTPISAIAEKVGYCYSNSFSRAFRQSENMTPNEYRKQHKDLL